MELTEEQWVAHATQTAFMLATVVIIQAFGHGPDTAPSAPASRSSILQAMIEQIEHSQQSFAAQAPEQLHQRCRVPFQALLDMLGILTTAHPDATLVDLTDEMRSMTVLLRASQQRPRV